MTYLPWFIILTFLLFALFIQARRQHKELMGLLNDLATMVGEWLEEQER